jgi:hypothetical protein
MKRLLCAITGAFFAGCATIHTANYYHSTGLESGETPIETVAIENTAWLLLKCIPLGSGDPESPNEFGCNLFSNTVTLQNNLDMLEREMERVGAKRITNLASRKTDESIFIILLTRRACHTSAVLLK